MKISRKNLGMTPLEFFLRLRSTETSVALVRSGQWTVIAWDPKKTLSLRSSSDLRTFQRLLNRRKKKSSPLPFVGGAIGAISYELACEYFGAKLSQSDAVTPSFFHIYDSAVVFGKGITYIVGDQSFKREVESIALRPQYAVMTPPIHFDSSTKQSAYKKIFEKIRHDIIDGEYYQLNLTRELSSRHLADPRMLFASLFPILDASSASYLEHGENAIVSLSPERFLRIEKDRVITSPIKGTRPRGVSSKHDRKLLNELLKSEKECAELTMITDLLRNDLSKVCIPGSVTVRETRGVQKNPSVWHTYATIEGRKLPSLTPFDAFLSMLPGGSITGCPKLAAVESIHRYEKRQRGFYCGCMAMISDSGHLESSILIRTIVKQGDRLSLGVGGGIVYDSKASHEWDETERKADAFLQSLTPGVSQSQRFDAVFVNGKRTHDPTYQALLDPTNPLSRGVFTTFIFPGASLHEHERRLLRAAQKLGLKSQAMKRNITELMKQALERVRKKTRVKVLLTKHDVIIGLRAPEQAPSLLTACFIQGRRKSPGVKTHPYTEEWAAFKYARDKGVHEALFVSRGRVLEGARSNLFIVKGRNVVTARQGVLLGTERAHCLRLLHRLGYRLILRAPTMSEFLKADEAFLTNAVMGVQPLVMVDGKIIGSGKCGKITAVIKKARQKECAKMLTS